MALVQNNLQATLRVRTQLPAVTNRSSSARKLVESAATHDNFRNFMFMLDPSSEPLPGEPCEEVAREASRRFSAELFNNVVEMTRTRLHKAV